MEQMIRERQRWVWLLSALSVVAATEVCAYHWIWAGVAGLLMAGYYLWLERVTPSAGLADRMVSLGWAGKGMILLTLIWNVIAMGWAAALVDQAFPMVDGFPVLGWVLLLAAAWGSWKGAAVCGRCCGVLSLFLLFLYGIVVVFAVPDISMQNLKPMGDWKEGIWTAGLLLTGSGVWYVPCLKKTEKLGWNVAWMLPIGILALSVVTTGVLSPSLVAVSQVPLYVVAQSVSLFGVIERIESLLSAAMTMGVFALLSTIAAACQSLGNALKPWRNYGVVCCVLASGTMFLNNAFTAEFRTFCAVIVWILLPVSTIVAVHFRGRNG